VMYQFVASAWVCVKGRKGSSLWFSCTRTDILCATTVVILAKLPSNSSNDLYQDKSSMHAYKFLYHLQIFRSTILIST